MKVLALAFAMPIAIATAQDSAPSAKTDTGTANGTAENFRGKALSETGWQRDWNQYAGDLVYRFMDERMYVGARANTANGKLTGIANKVSLDRNALAAGWYVTPVLLMKGEYMQQKYYQFPTSDIRSGGKIQGFVVEGVVSF